MCSERNGRSPESGFGYLPRAMNRRNFLKLSGAGLAGVALLGAVGTGLTQEAPPRVSSLAEEFKQAAEEYAVPMELLMAMGYVNTRWEMPPPWANVYTEGDLHGWGSYGIMALVQNPYSDTLGDASRLTGIPEEELKTNRAANIRGGAALLASAAGKVDPQALSAFFGAVAGRGLAGGTNYVAVSGIGGGELYGEQVFEALQTGASATIFSGETVVLPALQPAASGFRGA